MIILNKDYLRKLIHYLSSVYNIDENIKKIKDSRTNPKIPTSSIAISLLIGFMLKIRSFNQLDDWLEHNDFKRIVARKMRFPRIDAIRDSLKVMGIKTLNVFHYGIIRTSIKNKLVRDGTIDGYTVAAFDGVELFESIKKSCKSCLTRVMRGVPHYFHKTVVAAYVGKDPCIVIGQEMLQPKLDSSKKDEGEMTASKRLLKNLYLQLGHFADVIVYDALACNAPWINMVISYGMESVIRVMNKRLNIAKAAKDSFKGRPADEIWEFSDSNNTKTKVSAWETVVSMNGVTKLLKYVKFIKKVTNIKTGKSKYTQMCIISTSHTIPLKTLFKIIKARWWIENSVFRQLKVQWHMEHCFIHYDNGIEATLMFMITAFNLMQLFFFRRLKDFRKKRLLQVQIIERIIKEMVNYKANGCYICDTS